MKRITKKQSDGDYIMSDELIHKVGSFYTGQAIEKLGKMEDMYEDLQQKQKEITEKMDKLRSEGKEKSVKFRELLGNKIMNNNILAVLDLYV